MKKIIAGVLLAAMVGTLAGCSSQGGSDVPETEPATQAPAETQAADETHAGWAEFTQEVAEEYYCGTWVDQADPNMIMRIGPTEEEGYFDVFYTLRDGAEVPSAVLVSATAEALPDGALYYENGFRSITTFTEDEPPVEEVQYTDGSGTLFVWGDGTLAWSEHDSDMNVTEYVFVREDEPNGGAGMQNPWTELTAEEAAQYINFAVPEGAENVVYRLMEAEGQEPLAEVQFDLNGLSFNMREQRGAAATDDISGMYYDWTAQDGVNVWGSIPGSAYRYIGEDETADLLTWYIEEIGTSYALSTVAPSLDGFDIVAVANMMAPQ
ncbi:MAG: YgdI/YgdR family lipoprotein [Lachnospiraceae bacterium]|nr:YgdI/YgdR family lipoprotein [Lachnospiraceae bacterium]